MRSHGYRHKLNHIALECTWGKLLWCNSLTGMLRSFWETSRPRLPHTIFISRTERINDVVSDLRTDDAAAKVHPKTWRLWQHCCSCSLRFRWEMSLQVTADGQVFLIILEQRGETKTMRNVCQNKHLLVTIHWWNWAAAASVLHKSKITAFHKWWSFPADNASRICRENERMKFYWIHTDPLKVIR